MSSVISRKQGLTGKLVTYKSEKWGPSQDRHGKLLQPTFSEPQLFYDCP